MGQLGVYLTANSTEYTPMEVFSRFMKSACQGVFDGV